MYITIILILSMLVVFLCIYIYQTKEKVKKMNLILENILDGNLDRRLIVKDHSKLSQTYFIINKIVTKYKEEIMTLQQSEKTYKQLITNLSHDIRTPLSSLMGYLGAIEDGIVIEAEKEEFFKLSYEKASILKNYIDTLFEWLKLESGEHMFHFEKKDIYELSREIMIEWIPQLEQRQIEYQIAIPDKETELLLDENSYRRILNNLLQNAMMHSQANKIKIEIQETKEKIFVSVEDNGIGISEIDLPHIFERLYKCDSARNGKGNGLGLAIVAELLKANDGSIQIVSKQGEGSTFIITFSKNKK